VEELHDQLRKVNKMGANLQDVLNYRHIASPYRPNFVKPEEDTRMMDVMPTSRGNSYTGRPVSPGSAAGSYQEAQEYWNGEHEHLEHGRSKYKKRSVRS